MFPFDTENFMIYLDNLSAYHVFFDVLSFLTVFFTVWYCRRLNVDTISETQTENAVLTTECDDSKESDLDENEFPLGKSASQRTLLQQMNAKLTKNELEEEKRVERMQLEKIFELLRNQEDKFRVTSMEQLQDQLSLYRI